MDSNTSFFTLETTTTASQASSSWNPSGYFWTPRYNDAVQPDPLQSITQPSAGGCIVNNYSQSNVSSNQSAPSGTYCGNSSYSCANQNVVISFSPGLYVFAGGLSISGCTVSGSGATIYFTKNPNDGTYGKLALTNDVLNMTAPSNTSNGGITGVLFMTDRNWTSTNAQDFVLDTCQFNGDGIWYLTNAGLSIKSGYLNAPHYAVILAENLLLSNTTVTLNEDFSGVPTGNPLRRTGTIAE